MPTLKPATFKNEIFLDFSDPVVLAHFLEAFEKLSDSLPKIVVPKIFNYVTQGSQSFQRTNPSKSLQTVSYVHFASKDDALVAVDRLAAFQEEFEASSLDSRVSTLRKAAALMRERKFDLIALVTLEAGKPFIEADREICEAIDFCEYYALEAEKLLVESVTEDDVMAEGNAELNSYFYQPRGVTTVISPWNFPFAITCGMTVAALVCGNVVALKPSRQTSAVAAALVEILFAAGIPRAALAFLPGAGAEIGGVLSSDPRVSLYCFTGSREVGLELIQKGATVAPRQTHIKRVIAELGGKNAMIVDVGVDLDKAAIASNYSAFGYSGQKCSACSRVIVVGDAYEPFLAALKRKAEANVCGDASEPGVLIGPVIDESSQKRIGEFISVGKKTEQIFWERAAPDGGTFSATAIFRDVPQSSPLWKEEIFGPVLVVCRAKDFKHAVELANDSDYGLTGGVFSNSSENLDYAKRKFKVGNLYFNRSTTGALVNRQPFGGFKLSGVGSKAGGKDYLLQFVEPRSLSAR